MKRLSVIFAVLMVLCAASAFADVVYLNAGEEIVGSLKKVAADKVYFTDVDGKDLELSVDGIAHILISKIRQGDEINNVASLTEPLAAGIILNPPDTSAMTNANYVTLFRLHEREYISESEVKTNLREIIKVLKEPGLDVADQSFSYLSNRSEFELEYAHTYSPNGKVYHVTDDAVSEEGMRLSTPEYARTKRLKFAMKKVDVGSVVDYSYRSVTKDIDCLHPYTFGCTFGEREPVFHEEFAVTFPDGMDIRKVLKQWPENGAPKFLERKHDGKTTWKWIYSNPVGYIPEQNMLPAFRIFPRVFIYTPYDMKKTAEQLKDAYLAAKPSDKLLEELFKRAEIDMAENTFDKAARIYLTLNKELLRVHANTNAMGDHRPISGDITLTKKYGNSQAVLSVMHFALEKLGIKSYPGFSSGKRANVTIDACPTLGVANNAVLKVVIDGCEYFTDGGSASEPFGSLSTAFQGASAVFLDMAAGDFFYQKMPVQTHEWNRFSRNVAVKIKENGTMDVFEILSYRGPFEAPLRSFKSAKDKEKQNYAERRIKSVHPNAVLNSFGFSDLEDLNAPVTLTLNYSIAEAAQLASDRIMTFTNFWINYNASSASLKTRKFPMQYWATEENQQTVVFELPEGFDWVKWDKQYQFVSPEVSFRSGMNKSANHLIYSDIYFADADEFTTNDSYQNYRKCLLTMSELANQWIIIEKIEKKEDNAQAQSADVPSTASETPVLSAASEPAVISAPEKESK